MLPDRVNNDGHLYLGVAQLVARYLGVVEAASSSLVTQTKPEEFEECKRVFVEAPETVTIVQTTGNCHLVAICLSPDVKTMREFVNKIYRTVPGITSINAHSVLDVVKGSIIPENNDRSACINEQS